MRGKQRPGPLNNLRCITHERSEVAGRAEGASTSPFQGYAQHERPPFTLSVAPAKSKGREGRDGWAKGIIGIGSQVPRAVRRPPHPALRQAQGHPLPPGERERQGKDKRPAPAGSGGNVGAATGGCPSWLPQECPLRRPLRQIAETGSKCPKKTESQKYRCRRSQTRLRPPRDQPPGDGESGGPYSRQRPQ